MVEYDEEYYEYIYAMQEEECLQRAMSSKANTDKLVQPRGTFYEDAPSSSIRRYKHKNGDAHAPQH